ncbi:MAG: PRC-barrel domain-containing protein [Thermoanaerobaculia bacterium]
MNTTTAKDVRSTLSASALIGDKVVNRRGEDLGKIEDLMVEPEQGRVSYAVLSFGGFLGMGDKLFAIPMQAMKLSREEKKLILDIDKEKLKNAPGFDKNHWPDFNDRSYGSKLYSYYGYTPHWS